MRLVLFLSMVTSDRVVAVIEDMVRVSITFFGYLLKALFAAFSGDRNELECRIPLTLRSMTWSRRRLVNDGKLRRVVVRRRDSG